MVQLDGNLAPSSQFSFSSFAKSMPISEQRLHCSLIHPYYFLYFASRIHSEVH